jgi:hypothetical protein
LRIEASSALSSSGARPRSAASRALLRTSPRVSPREV